MMYIQTLLLHHPHDVGMARQHVRQLAQCLGFDLQMQVQLATAVTEMAYHLLSDGQPCVVECGIQGETAPQVLLIRMDTTGADVSRHLGPAAAEETAENDIEQSLRDVRQLVDACERHATPAGGIGVILRQHLPEHAPLLSGQSLARLTADLMRPCPPEPLNEAWQQHRMLLHALQTQKQQREELQRLRHELDETNRGVVALYAELDARAEHLQHADEAKSRFLSNMSHEFRVPINAIRSLTRLLLDQVDGTLTDEQEKQIAFIQKAVEELAELVNDLLDLAKIESGKVTISPTEFEVAELFGTLRRMLRPLLHDAVTLVFDIPVPLPPLMTDEEKVTQILRNLISNALKYTNHGEIRVSASLTPEARAVIFTVTDTGIGIASDDQERIFEDFVQVDHALQRRVKGTGLGLPLCKKLAELLGGSIAVQSDLGVGSCFTAVIPRVVLAS
jgi:signal transduction histidine kinase